MTDLFTQNNLMRILHLGPISNSNLTHMSQQGEVGGTADKQDSKQEIPFDTNTKYINYLYIYIYILFNYIYLRLNVGKALVP